MIRDTSATDRLVEVGSNRNRKLIYIGAGIAVVAALAFAAPHVATMFSADSSVSGAPIVGGCNNSSIVTPTTSQI